MSHALPPARPGIVGLERGRRGLGRLEALKDQVGDGAGAALVADEAHHVGGVIGRQAFEHAKFIQAKPNKTKQKSLDFLGFLWPNLDFSMGYGESKQKNLFPRHTVPQMSQNALRLLSWRPELHDAESGELKFIAWISGLRNKMPGAFPPFAALPELPVCAAKRVTGSPLAAAGRVTAGVFGAGGGINTTAFFRNRQ